VALGIGRINWKFGRSHINILMLDIIHGKIYIPLFWVLLDKAGNSLCHTPQRKHTVLAKRVRTGRIIHPCKTPQKGPSSSSKMAVILGRDEERKITLLKVSN